MSAYIDFPVMLVLDVIFLVQIFRWLRVLHKKKRSFSGEYLRASK